MSKNYNLARNRNLNLVPVGRLLYPETGYWRPETRADCANVCRPCPYVGCRYNNYLEVSGPGSVLPNHPEGVEPWDVNPETSCALDVADRGTHTHEEVGAAVGVSRERVRQHLARSAEALAVLREHFEPATPEPSADNYPRRHYPIEETRR